MAYPPVSVTDINMNKETSSELGSISVLRLDKWAQYLLQLLPSKNGSSMLGRLHSV